MRQLGYLTCRLVRFSILICLTSLIRSMSSSVASAGHPGLSAVDSGLGGTASQPTEGAVRRRPSRAQQPPDDEHLSVTSSSSSSGSGGAGGTATTVATSGPKSSAPIDVGIPYLDNNSTNAIVGAIGSGPAENDLKQQPRNRRRLQDYEVRTGSTRVHGRRLCVDQGGFRHKRPRHLFMFSTGVHVSADLSESASQAADPYASPLRAPELTDLPPAQIFTVERDPLCDQGEAYGHRIQQAGVPVVIRCYRGQVQASSYLTGLFPSARDYVSDICSTLRDAHARGATQAMPSVRHIEVRARPAARVSRPGFRIVLLLAACGSAVQVSGSRAVGSDGPGTGGQGGLGSTAAGAVPTSATEAGAGPA